MPARIRKLGLAALSASAALGLGLAFWPESKSTATVDLIDIGAELEELLAPRSLEADPGAGGASADVDPTTFGLDGLDEEVIRTLIPRLGETNRDYDPVAGFRRSSHLDFRVGFPEHPDGGWRVRTDARGFREDEPVRSDRPGLRIVSVGDSHAEGLCANRESFANLLEQALAADGRDAEVINAAVGGYSFFNYLGALRNCLDLEPDVFLLVVYGGNDFSGLMPYERYFHRRGAPVRTFGELGPLRGPDGAMPGVVPQDLAQVLYFARNPEDVERSVDMAAAVTDRMARICRENGIVFACAYLPAPSQVQPRAFGQIYAQALRQLDVDVEDIRVSDRLSNGWLAHLAQRGIAHVDLRETFAASTEPVYWFSDLHINLLGQRLVAEQLLTLVRSAEGAGF